MAQPISRLWTVCSDCGTPWEREQSQSRCPDCHPPAARTPARIESESRRGTRQSRGYGAAWTRLSRRARRLQPWCSDCGRPDGLTGDHSPRAWRRYELGLPIRLEDVDVVCRRCNAERGPARGPDAQERPTIGDQRRELDAMTEELTDDDDSTDGLDQRIARGELP